MKGGSIDRPQLLSDDELRWEVFKAATALNRPGGSRIRWSVLYQEWKSRLMVKERNHGK